MKQRYCANIDTCMRPSVRIQLLRKSALQEQGDPVLVQGVVLSQDEPALMPGDPSGALDKDILL